MSYEASPHLSLPLQLLASKTIIILSDILSHHGRDQSRLRRRKSHFDDLSSCYNFFFFLGLGGDKC